MQTSKPPVHVPTRWTQKEAAFELGVDVRTFFNYRSTLKIQPVAIRGNVLEFDPAEVKVKVERYQQKRLRLHLA